MKRNVTPGQLPLPLINAPNAGCGRYTQWPTPPTPATTATTIPVSPWSSTPVQTEDSMPCALSPDATAPTTQPIALPVAPPSQAVSQRSKPGAEDDPQQ